MRRKNPPPQFSAQVLLQQPLLTMPEVGCLSRRKAIGQTYRAGKTSFAQQLRAAAVENTGRRLLFRTEAIRKLLGLDK